MRTPPLWRQWTSEERKGLPGPWPRSGDRRRSGDGFDFELRSRTVEIDPLDQRVVLEIRAEKLRDGKLVAAEEHAISMRMYFRDELQLMLERAGFDRVEVRGGYADEEPTADHEFLVYIART
jgi:hypothetical protein